MLININKRLKGYPSIIINSLSFGYTGGSLCARLFLYKKYISNHNMFINSLKWAIDLFEKDHCELAAKVWRHNWNNSQAEFPAAYMPYLRINDEEI